MNKQVCKYSIIRFQPYTDTGEFVNIGIVLYVPDSGRLVYEILDPRQHERITRFFYQMKKKLFRNTVQIIRAELERIKNLLEQGVPTNVDLYHELIRPREDIIRYSENSVVVSTDTQQTVNELFEHYVHRRFIQHEADEVQMTKLVRALLKENDLAEQFKAGFVGDKNKYALRFPFVSTNVHQAIIKPIHFRQSNSKRVIEHGLIWLGKINQLKRYGYLQPEKTLFAYKAPETKSGKLFEAFEDISAQIKDAGIVMADIKMPKKITDFVVSRVGQKPPDRIGQLWPTIQKSSVSIRKNK